MTLVKQGVQDEPFAELSRFRGVFYDCLTGRRDALFELTDAVLCTDGPVRTRVDLALVPEHRRGHGALYGAPNRGSLDVDRLRTCVGRTAAATRRRLPPGPGGGRLAMAAAGRGDLPGPVVLPHLRPRATPSTR